MKKISLIACASTKGSKEVAAIELYQSDLFKKSVAYSHFIGVDDIYILSAKKGLVHQSEIIAPYDLTLNNLSARERRDWGERVISKLNKMEDINECQFVLLAGAKYRETIITQLCHCIVPLKGLGIGQQLQWLKQQTNRS